MFQSGAPKFLWSLFFCLFSILSLPLSSVAQKSKAQPKILYLTHSAGFKHDVLPVFGRCAAAAWRAIGCF